MNEFINYCVDGAEKKRVIVCAAMRDNNTGNVLCSVRHGISIHTGCLIRLKRLGSLKMNKALLTTKVIF